jgi:hypothetical protein
MLLLPVLPRQLQLLLRRLLLLLLLLWLLQHALPCTVFIVCLCARHAPLLASSSSIPCQHICPSSAAAMPCPSRLLTTAAAARTFAKLQANLLYALLCTACCCGCFCLCY